MLGRPKHLTEFARENKKAPTKAERLLRSHLRGERFDGWSHDDTYEADLERQAKLEKEGFEFLRYSNAAVLEDPGAIAESISHFCVERAKLLYGENYAKRRATAKRPDPPLTPPGAGGGTVSST